MHICFDRPSLVACQQLTQRLVAMLQQAPAHSRTLSLMSALPPCTVQDGHRQRTVNWVDSTGGTNAAFDFTTKGILQEALARSELWRLVDAQVRGGKSYWGLNWER
jgi:hypothetical protein